MIFLDSIINPNIMSSVVAQSSSTFACFMEFYKLPQRSKLTETKIYLCLCVYSKYTCVYTHTISYINVYICVYMCMFIQMPY